MPEWAVYSQGNQVILHHPHLLPFKKGEVLTLLFFCDIKKSMSGWSIGQEVHVITTSFQHEGFWPKVGIERQSYIYIYLFIYIETESRRQTLITLKLRFTFHTIPTLWTKPWHHSKDVLGEYSLHCLPVKSGWNCVKFWRKQRNDAVSQHKQTR